MPDICHRIRTPLYLFLSLVLVQCLAIYVFGVFRRSVPKLDYVYVPIGLGKRYLRNHRHATRFLGLHTRIIGVVLAVAPS